MALPAAPRGAAPTHRQALPRGAQALHRSGGALPPVFPVSGTRVAAPARRAALRVEARQQPPRRLASYVLSFPLRVEQYFQRYPLRKVLWSGIALCAGFYSGNVVTLSFGALAINDILAAVVTLAFYEAVTFAFYRAKTRTLRLYFANFFKIGVTVALLADALKLGGS